MHNEYDIWTEHAKIHQNLTCRKNRAFCMLIPNIAPVVDKNQLSIRDSNYFLVKIAPACKGLDLLLALKMTKVSFSGFIFTNSFFQYHDSSSDFSL
jgi:hypothetical protein